MLGLGVRSGELNASTILIPNSSVYNRRVAPASAPTQYIKRIQTTAAIRVFAGLTPGQIDAVDANVAGSAGPGDWSDAARLMAV